MLEQNNPQFEEIPTGLDYLKGAIYLVIEKLGLTKLISEKLDYGQGDGAEGEEIISHILD